MLAGAFPRRAQLCFAPGVWSYSAAGPVPRVSNKWAVLTSPPRSACRSPSGRHRSSARGMEKAMRTATTSADGRGRSSRSWRYRTFPKSASRNVSKRAQLGLGLLLYCVGWLDQCPRFDILHWLGGDQRDVRRDTSEAALQEDGGARANDKEMWFERSCTYGNFSCY